jgi:LPPG:FO 2-phospho-L-lactate transferase
MRVVALAGGVGGAKLADGLAQSLPPEDLTVIVNTGDDFEHLGLTICPDLDTVCYTLAGLANPDTGWGRADESWQAFQNLERLGGPTWFRLGDRDLATHLERARRLKAGESLSQVTKAFCAAWGVGPTVLPMSDQPVPTVVLTDEGELAFQEYFVARHFEPRVTGFRFEGAADAEPAPGLLDAIEQTDLIVFCPSNPWVSIDPILAVPGIRDALGSKLVIAVSPIVGGDVVKGPAAKMYADLGITPSATAVAQHYEGLLSAFVLDEVDRDLVENLDVQTYVSDTIMKTAAHRRRLAEEILFYAKNY